MTIVSSFKSLLLTCLVPLTLSSCGGGGGGGGDDFVGAAQVTLRLQPSRIDSGDRSEVSTEVGQVHPNGIALKFRYPDGLRYVPQSAVLLIDENEVDLTPTVNAGAGAGKNDVFLVFYLSQELFIQSGQEYNGESGTVSFQLEGITSVRDGAVEVDADVDDPQEDNSSEFQLDNPEFAAEDEAFIEVVD